MHEDLSIAIDAVTDAVGTSRFGRKLGKFRQILENALTEDRFDDVNQFLSGIKPEDHSNEVLVALLEVTKDADDQLPDRGALWDTIAGECTRRGENPSVLLAEC